MIAVLENLLVDALQKLQKKGVISVNVSFAVVVTPTSDPRFGDFSSNIALTLARPTGMTAADMANALIAELPPCPAMGRIAVGGPGFINFFHSQAGQAAIIESVLQQAAQYGRSKPGRCRSVQLENINTSTVQKFTLNHGRSVALASTMASMLDATGFSVHRRYSDTLALNPAPNPAPNPNSAAVDSSEKGNDFHSLIAKVRRNKANDIDRLICIFPADLHHEAIELQTVWRVAGHAPEKLHLVPVESVSLCDGAEHTCELVQQGSGALTSDFLDEIGEDSARFLFLMNKPSRPLHIDLQLAGSQSKANPVYEVQLAHALICSVLRQQEQRQLAFDPGLGSTAVHRLQERIERDIIALLAVYPQFLRCAALNCQPWRLTQYLTDLAKHLHNYYKIHKVLAKDVELRHARVSLLLATRQVLSNALGVIGVSVPEVM